MIGSSTISEAPSSSGQTCLTDIANPQTPVAQPRLVRAAHEFEAAMMKELIAPLEPGHDCSTALGAEEGEDLERGGSSSSALSSFAGEALAKGISEHGGFGIARSIIARLGSP